jgi:hypothetical protein
MSPVLFSVISELRVSNWKGKRKRKIYKFCPNFDAQILEKGGKGWELFQD